MAQPYPCAGGVAVRFPHPGPLWGLSTALSTRPLCPVSRAGAALLGGAGVRLGLLCGNLWHHDLPSEQALLFLPATVATEDKYSISSVLPFWEEKRRS